MVTALHRRPAQSRKLIQQLTLNSKSPVSRRLHLLLRQFEIGVVAAVSKKLLTVSHIKAPLNPEPRAICVALKHQQRCVGRDDVELFRQADNLILNELGTALLQQIVQMHSGP